MKDFNKLVLDEIDKAVEKSLCNIKSDAIKKAVKETIREAVIEKMEKDMKVTVADFVADAIGDLSKDIKQPNKSKLSEKFPSNNNRSGSKNSSGGKNSSNTPSPHTRRITYGGKGGNRHGGK